MVNAELQARTEIVLTNGKVIADGQKTITHATELPHKLNHEHTRREKLSSGLQQEFESRLDDLRALERSLEAMIQNQTDEMTLRHTCINGFQVLGERQNRMAEAKRLCISELERRQSEKHKKIDILQAYVEGLPQKIWKQVTESDSWKLVSAKLNTVNEQVNSTSRVFTETLVPGLDGMRPGVTAISKDTAVGTKNITAVLNEQQTTRRKFERLCQDNVTIQQVADLDAEFKNLVRFAGDIAACTKSISERIATAMLRKSR